jgi:archaellum component FlaC
MDATTVTVVQNDLEEVSGQVSAIMGSTGKMDDASKMVQESVEQLMAQFKMIDTALSQLTEQKGGNGEGNDLVYSQLQQMSAEIQKLTVGKGEGLEKMYTMEAERKDDITYLKNKTEELKAMLEMSKKMVDNVANKPVTQTWYEFD